MEREIVYVDIATDSLPEKYYKEEEVGVVRVSQRHHGKMICAASVEISIC